MRGPWLALAMIGVGLWGLIVFFWKGYVFFTLATCGWWMLGQWLREPAPPPEPPPPEIPVARAGARLHVDADGRAVRRRRWW